VRIILENNICINFNIHLYVYVHESISVCEYMHIYTNKFTGYIYIYMHVCVYQRVYVCVYVCVWVCGCQGVWVCACSRSHVRARGSKSKQEIARKRSRARAEVKQGESGSESMCERECVRERHVEIGSEKGGMCVCRMKRDVRLRAHESERESYGDRVRTRKTVHVYERARESK